MKKMYYLLPALSLLMAQGYAANYSNYNQEAYYSGSQYGNPNFANPSYDPPSSNYNNNNGYNNNSGADYSNYQNQSYNQGQTSERPYYLTDNQNLQNNQGFTQGSYGPTHGFASQDMPGNGQTTANDQFMSDSDKKIGQRIRQALATKNIDGNNISLFIDSGKVTLKGTVNNEEVKHKIASLVKYQSGVRGVDNKLETAQSFKSNKMNQNSSQNGNQNLNQGQRGFNSNSQLQNNTNPNSYSNNDSYQNDNLAATDSSTSLHNQNSMDDTNSDQNLTWRIRQTLDNDNTIKGSNIQVSSSNGVVTLSGKAKNSQERSLIGQRIKQIKGVKSIDNQIKTGTSQ